MSKETMAFTFPNSNASTQFKIPQPPITPTTNTTNNTNNFTSPLSQQQQQQTPSTNTTPIRKRQPKHKSFNNSISSITSSTSDLTIYESSILSSKQLSTDTLIDEKQLPPLPPPPTSSALKHRYNQSLDSNRTLVSLDENEEDKFKFTINNNIDCNNNSNTSSSPIDSFFQLSTPPPPIKDPQPDFFNQQHSRPKLPSMHSTPSLKKQVTLPSLSFDLSLKNIKQEQLKRLNYIPLQNFRPDIEKLSDRIQYVCPIEFQGLCTAQDNLVIDIRPFVEYSKSHVKSSLNICLPSTLLKRSNFSLIRSINSLPDFEKNRFTEFLNNTKGDLVVYDSTENSSNLYHICNKIITCANFMTCPEKKICLLDTNFLRFNELFPNAMETASPEVEDNNFLSPIIVPEKLRSSSVSDLSPYHKATPLSSSSSSSMLSANTPILSANFTLPSKCKSFKIRHNEELPTIPCGNPFEENTANLFKLSNIPSDCSKLPEWIKQTIFDESGNPVTFKINNQFYSLEKLEQKRLITALSLNTVNDISPMNEVAPKISCGIEFGNKNRYKDIFLYDHSRVELGHVNNNPNDILNYINASFIEPPEKYHHPESKYIATQGPLDETMGDLWKLVLIRNIPLVISLTDSIENGIMKCAPFWQSGIYKSYEDTIRVTVVNNEEIDENLIVRTFKIKCNDEPSREVKQIQLLSWPDMGTTSDPRDILKVVGLKQKILAESSIKDKTTLVHCSAGCGRTGTLCVIDTLINYLKDNGDLNTEEEDPVFEITNHFRKLRISMVQTLKQYYLIYETLISYFDNKNQQ